MFAFSRRRLLPFGFESYAEDVVQDVFVDVIKSFSKFDPATGPFFPRLWKIVRNTLHDQIHKDRVRLREVPLPDNTEAEGQELQVDPLDQLSREAWETEVPTQPIPMSNRFGLRRFGRATVKAREERCKEKEAALATARGRKKRSHRYKPVWEIAKINRNRKAFAEASP